MIPIFVAFLLFQSLVDSTDEAVAALKAKLTRDFRANVELAAAPKTRTLLQDLATRAAASAGLKATPSVEITQRSVTPPKLAALPGGAIFVPVDLVRAAKDASDLTRLIAHAVAHMALDERRPRLQEMGRKAPSILYPDSGLCEAQSSLRGTAPLHRPEIEAEADALTERIATALAAPPQDHLREAQEELLTVAPPKPRSTLYRAGEPATSSPAPQH